MFNIFEETCFRNDFLFILLVGYFLWRHVWCVHMHNINTANNDMHLRHGEFVTIIAKQLQGFSARVWLKSNDDTEIINDILYNPQKVKYG